MEHDPHSLPCLVRRWQVGWGMCRGLRPATEAGGGLHVELGLPGRSREIIVLDADGDPESVRSLAAEIVGATEPAWLTVPTRQPAAVEAALAQAGMELFGASEALMSVELRVGPSLEPPEPYEMVTTVAGSIIDTQIHLPGGKLAARGTMAVVGRDATAHNIQTFPSHRRRGLASAAMSALAGHAVELGASTGLLVASPDGQKLYSRLGWSVAATVLTATAVPLSATSQ